MKRITIAVVLAVALIVALAASRPAQADWTSYDTFSASPLDGSLWKAVSSGAFGYAISGGNLVLTGTSVGSSLYFKARTSLKNYSGVEMSYSSFSSNNSSAAGEYSTAKVVLAVTDSSLSYSYMIGIFKDATGEYLWCGYVSGTTVYTYAKLYSTDSLDLSSGKLAIIGGDSDLVFEYYDSATSTWKVLYDYGSHVSIDNPVFYIGASTGNSSSLSVNIDEVSLKATPLPAAAWLLGSGLLGLAGLRKRIKK